MIIFKLIFDSAVKIFSAQKYDVDVIDHEHLKDFLEDSLNDSLIAMFQFLSLNSIHISADPSSEITNNSLYAIAKRRPR